MIHRILQFIYSPGQASQNKNAAIGIIASWGGAAMTLSNLECMIRIIGGVMGCIVGALTIINIVRGMKRKQQEK